MVCSRPRRIACPAARAAGGGRRDAPVPVRAIGRQALRAVVLVSALAWGPVARAVVDLQPLVVERPGPGDACATLELDGTAFVTVANSGTTATAEGFEVLVFVDRDRDGQYDGGTDLALGVTVVPPPLRPAEEIAVAVPVVGTLRFRDEALAAWVDAAQAIAETDETDNVVDGAADCQRPAPAPDYQPVVEWEWTDEPVATTPLVGDVNADGTPDVVFVADDALLHVLDGRTGSPIWQAGEDTSLAPMSTPALGELDGDPGLEIVALHGSGLLFVAFDDDGSELWTSEEALSGWGDRKGGVTLADLDCDGHPEAIYGRDAVRTQDGRRFWTPEDGGTAGINSNYSGFSTVADVNGDGWPDVVAGPSAYTWEPSTGTGRLLWRTGVSWDGFTAIGQFDDDPAPEVALVSLGVLRLFEGDTGELIWELELPLDGGGCRVQVVRCGAPVVADVDGDGQAEIGVACADWYSMVERDGTIKWQVPSSDCSSAATSSTVFDFDDDGAAEVVYQDEYDLHVYRGSDGFELASAPVSSRTVQEMATIADVDGDNRAEIISALSPYEGLTHQGIRVHGDRNDNWVNARRIWNQNAYHVDNVTDQGVIPSGRTGPCAPEYWLTHGTFRLQRLDGGSPLSQPDVTLTTLSSSLDLSDGCNPWLTIEGRVGNGGSQAFGRAVDVRLHEGDPAAGGVEVAATVAPDLAPGEWWDFSLTVRVTQAATFHLLADDDGRGGDAVGECREDNNRCAVEVDPGVFTRPAPVGSVLRALSHGSPTAPQVTAVFSWAGDEGLPRPAEEHYHVLRGTRPEALTHLAESEPWTELEWDDATERSVQVPACHYYRVVAADSCERLEAVD